jgi:hypothetical protein
MGRSAISPCGMGSNIIFVDPENDVVAVMRWIDGGSIDGFVRRLLAALDQHTQSIARRNLIHLLTQRCNRWIREIETSDLRFELGRARGFVA